MLREKVKAGGRHFQHLLSLKKVVTLTVCALVLNAIRNIVGYSTWVR